MTRTHYDEIGKPTSISLFSGAGGLDVGFEQTGFHTVFAIEIDRDAADSWRINRPKTAHVMVNGDINEHLNDIAAFHDVDVIFGGPPCQGFSVAGKMDPCDERSQLVWRFMDAVEMVRPKIFVMENVAALETLKKWENIRTGILNKGKSLDYNVSFKVHHTSDYGVPENRDRVIFIGIRKDVGIVEPFYNQLSQHKRLPSTARETILSVGLFGTDENPQTCTASITLAAHPVMRRSPYAGMLVNGAGRPIDLDGIAPTLPASMGGNKTPIVDEIALHDPSVPNWFATYHADLIAGRTTPEKSSIPSTVRRQR